MKLQLSEIMEATISELEDIDMMLAFEIVQIPIIIFNRKSYHDVKRPVEFCPSMTTFALPRLHGRPP